MTENKRYRVFKYHDCEEYGVSDDVAEYTLARFDNHFEAEGLCELLNELHEENRELQRHLDVMRSGALTDDKRIKELYNENEQLKRQMKKLESQLYCPYDSICIQCNNEYLVQKKEYYVSKCKKGYEQCSKVDVKYCDDFELKGDVE